MIIRSLIVDDEPIARRGIRNLLKAVHDIEIVGECGDGIEAVEAIRKISPDLVFLDVQLPELDGFGVIEALEKKEIPVIVFITAYDQFALEAFKVHALDYLLKPVKKEAFEIAVDRARAMLERGRTVEFDRKLASLVNQLSSERRYPERIVLRSARAVTLLSVKEIDWVEAYGDYVKLHTGGKKHLLRKTMTEMEAMLHPGKFIRTHRSVIVRIDRISGMIPEINGDYTLHLSNGPTLPLSRTYRERVFRALRQPEF